jgi:hypothetical protein
MLWAAAASAGTKGMWMHVFANWVSRIVKLLHVLKDAIVATIYICSWKHYSCYFIAQIAMKCCKWTYSWHVCIATLPLLMQCMCLPRYAWYTLSKQYNSCNLRVGFHMLLLLAEVSTASSSSQRRYTMHVSECLHQLSNSNSSAAVCTERRNSCNYIKL